MLLPLFAPGVNEMVAIAFPATAVKLVGAAGALT